MVYGLQGQSLAWPWESSLADQVIVDMSVTGCTETVKGMSAAQRAPACWGSDCGQQARLWSSVTVMPSSVCRAWSPAASQRPTLHAQPSTAVADVVVDCRCCHLESTTATATTTCAYVAPPATTTLHILSLCLHRSDWSRDSLRVQTPTRFWLWASSIACTLIKI